VAAAATTSPSTHHHPQRASSSAPNSTATTPCPLVGRGWSGERSRAETKKYQLLEEGVEPMDHSKRIAKEKKTAMGRRQERA